MSEWKKLLGTMRPPFLILAPACFLLGAGTAHWTTGSIRPLYFVLALIGAITSHISVNVFNEYFDFKSGVDLRTKRTPFSGGSGTLQANPELAEKALVLGFASLILTALIGFYFVAARGWPILILGIVGLLVIYFYTPFMAHDSFLCLIAPGLGFGTIMIMGTDFVLSGGFSRTAFVASLVPFFLVNNLLLLNQFPDVEADRSIQRRNLPIIIGRRNSSVIFVLFNLLAYLSIVFGVIGGLLPKWALLGLASAALAVPSSMGAYKNAEDMEKLVPSMGQNVIVNIATPVLMAIGLFIA